MRTLHLLRTPDILCANDNRPLVSNKLSNSRSWFWPWRCLVTEEVNNPLVCKVGLSDSGTSRCDLPAGIANANGHQRGLSRHRDGERGNQRQTTLSWLKVVRNWAFRSLTPATSIHQLNTSVPSLRDCGSAAIAAADARERILPGRQPETPVFRPRAGVQIDAFASPSTPAHYSTGPSCLSLICGSVRKAAV